MRKLMYECKKDGSTIKVSTLAQANELKMGGWSVSEVLEVIPHKYSLTPKQLEMLVRI